MMKRREFLKEWPAAPPMVASPSTRSYGSSGKAPGRQALAADRQARCMLAGVSRGASEETLQGRRSGIGPGSDRFFLALEGRFRIHQTGLEFGHALSVHHQSLRHRRHGRASQGERSGSGDCGRYVRDRTCQTFPGWAFREFAPSDGERPAWQRRAWRPGRNSIFLRRPDGTPFTKTRWRPAPTGSAV